MTLEENLYIELYKLRGELRRRRVAAGRREPNICSDDALHEMAAMVPTKVEDFAAIPGVGRVFVDQYAEDFLTVTKKYAVTAARGGDIDREFARTLRELQKKLVNISKSNRLLYLPKTGSKTSFDVSTAVGDNAVGLIHGRKRVLTLCDSSLSKSEGRVYNRLNNIIREVNRDKRERGANDLYLAYPFVEGRLLGDDSFPVRAPLALFPVSLEKTGTMVKMRMDDSRDAMFNNTLILAAMKMSRKHVPLPDNIIEDMSERDFLDDVIDFYKEQGIFLDPPARKSGTEPFIEYKASEFPKYRPGEYHIHNCVVVGKFTSYSSYIERDFDGILSNGDINGTLADLIRNLDRIDPYEDYGKEATETGDASEKELMYINSLNAAQEAVLIESDRKDELVVQGPPGTGKSQVITGLITAAVLRGETVLMVSEKKTALDVVYSRLGNLSKYCMQIDDTSDKKRFFNQLGVMLDIAPRRSRGDPVRLAEGIDEDVSKLDEIAEELYEPGEFGIPMCRLYAMDKWVDFTNPSHVSAYGAFKEGTGEGLLKLEYDRVAELKQTFSDSRLIDNIKEYADLNDKLPWLKLMHPDLSETQLVEFKIELRDIGKAEEELNHKGFLSRLFSKGAVARHATEVVNKYFTTVGNRMVTDIRSNPEAYSEALDDYDRYVSRGTVYKSLTDDEKEYGRDLLKISKETNSPFQETNYNLYRYILNYHLQKFDATHRGLMQKLRDFDSIVNDMDSKILMKRDLTREMFEDTLYDNLRYITESKRKGDIARLVENKRKWSLNKFLDRYGYEVFKGVRVWLMTPEVVSEILPLEMGLFDMLIFDEASQMYVERAIPSIYRAKKVVVAGDHKQLRPSSLGRGRMTYDDDDDEESVDPNTALEEESLLDLARARYDNILLNFHYRSKYEELIAFSNYAFYRGRLYVSPNVNRPENPPMEVLKVDGLWINRCNEAEADRIVLLLKQIFRERRNRETIGIISFNVTQRDLIADKIDEECSRDPAFAAAIASEEVRMDNGEDVGLFIKNIESVQGDERDIIIFSIGYAKNAEGRFMQRFGWLNVRGGENRLNVAISRAKKKVYIVNSFDPEELNVDNVKGEGPKILKKYLQYARAISDGNDKVAKAVLNSFGPSSALSDPTVDGEIPVADRVYNALVRKGYVVERNVGIGGYTMDLAIRQGDKYVLGIECDTRVYSMPGGTRERDYHRRKYLESRGWHVHRVWTPGMWKNPKDEIARIVDAVERAQAAE